MKAFLYSLFKSTLSFTITKNPITKTSLILTKNLSTKTSLIPTKNLKTTLIPTNMSSSSSLSSWTCQKCTFINSSSSSCQVCLSPSSLQENPSSWPCKTCTFLNPVTRINCEICGSRDFSSRDIVIEDDDEDLVSSSVGSVFFPLRSCGNKRKNQEDQESEGFRAAKSSKGLNSSQDSTINIADDDVDELRGVKPLRKITVSLGDEKGGVSGVNSEEKATILDEKTSKTESNTLKVMTYNVWFREDLEMHNRMRALGNLIRLHSPDIICFQEVTPDIYDIFQKSSWWKGYNCSVTNDMAVNRAYFCMQLSKLQVRSFSCKPFYNSIMGRELCITDLEVQKGLPLVVATTHLESPCPGPPKWDQMYSKERVEQAKNAIEILKQNQNVIFCGDMNWDDKLDGKFPVPDKWVDAWEKLRPKENGWTYDTKSNKMLSGNRALQKRLDRFICNVPDFEIKSIEMIGLEAIPGLSYIKEKKVKGEVKKLELPVLPSDHYGLLLSLSFR